jgi:hypothetical protein
MFWQGQIPLPKPEETHHPYAIIHVSEIRPIYKSQTRMIENYGSNFREP